METPQTTSRKMIFITGDLHIGKTTLVTRFVKNQSIGELRIAGILAKGLWKDGLRQGFDLLDLSTGQITPLARRREAPGSPASGNV